MIFWWNNSNPIRRSRGGVQSNLVHWKNRRKEDFKALKKKQEAKPHQQDSLI
jgi:hypothetical protein